MKDPTRSELLCRLAELSDEAPNFRFGQLIINLATAARGPEIESTWDVEDEELLAATNEWIARYREVEDSVPGDAEKHAKNVSPSAKAAAG